jgi:hypothetical protein
LKSEQIQILNSFYNRHNSQTRIFFKKLYFPNLNKYRI